MNYETLSNAELDRKVAELLGWKIVKYTSVVKDWQGNVIRVLGEPWEGFEHDMDGLANWQPSTDANQAREAVIAWCGDDMDRRREFSDALFTLACSEVYMDMPEAVCQPFALATATPRQMMEALLMAADEVKETEKEEK